MDNFDSFGLLPSILKAIKNKGYTTPTPIQEKSIAPLMEGKDLLGIAQTGTGKTAAFSLPIIHKLAKNPVKMRPKCVRVLILVPTRELASQVEESIKTYSVGMGQTSKTIFGGVGQAPQTRALSRGLDYAIATPGRLLDLMNNGFVKFDQLEVFILDEADRMLDMGMFQDVKRIIKHLPAKKHTLLFSATMPKDIENLAKGLLHNPIKVEVTPESSTVEKIEQSVCYVSKSNKTYLLAKLIAETPMKSVLVFSRTKYGADKIVQKLAHSKIEARAIHGNKSQGNREATLASFRNGKIKVLVATDIAARGIDIDHISHVINFNLPEDPSNYVHRIGRTARAGRSGIAISFCEGAELPLLRSIEKHIKLKLPVIKDQPFHEDIVEPKSDNSNKSRPSMSKKARRRRSFRG